jgi:pimeloyl-ACP methyl ester carboxylesterase
MDTYATDVAALVSHLDLKNAIHVGHSTGGGEATRYVSRYGGGGRVAKAVLIGAVPPIMLKTDSNPGGQPMSVFDQYRQNLAAKPRATRAQEEGNISCVQCLSDCFADLLGSSLPGEGRNRRVTISNELELGGRWLSYAVSHAPRPRTFDSNSTL